MQVNKYLIILFAGTVFSCNSTKNDERGPVLAKVFEKNLYKSEISEVVPRGLPSKDSMIIMKDHIDKWVLNQLLLHLAETNLTEEDKDVEQQINEYRTSLLIYKYQQNFIKEKLDTVITDEDVQKYYNNYSANFLLNNNLIKGRFVKLTRSAPKVWQLRRWYKSDDEEDIKKLETYCYENSADYQYFEEQWIDLDNVLAQMPKIYMSPENLLKYRKSYEVQDTNYYYFLKISDYRLESTVAPLEYIEENIRSILLNKRKVELIDELENSVYNDALNRGNFIVY